MALHQQLHVHGVSPSAFAAASPGPNAGSWGTFPTGEEQASGCPGESRLLMSVRVEV